MVTDELLRTIAKAYEIGGVEAVQRRTGRSRAQAYRLVSTARNAGWLERDELRRNGGPLKETDTQ